tara:strand:+ start:353 stop:478 length:126 start_codon:yes stop_codon:yes gene_type:complete
MWFLFLGAARKTPLRAGHDVTTKLTESSSIAKCAAQQKKEI